MFVTSRHSGETTASSAPRTSRLSVELLEHRLEDEVAAGVRLGSRARGDDRAEEARLALAEASLRDEARQLALDRLDRSLDPLGIDVGQHDGHLEAAEEEGRELRGHQAGADDADALDPPRRRLRDPRGPLDPPLDHVEGVDRRLRLGAGQQLGERLGLGGIALLERPRRRALDQLERPVGRGRLSVDGVVDAGARLPHDIRDVGEVGRRLALPLARLDPAEEELERLVDELDRVEHVVDEPELECVRGAAQAVLLERVVDDELHGGARADEARNELRAAPGGEEPEEHLGEADVADVRRHRADVAVEGELEAASEGGAVDRRQGGERQLAEAPEQLVTGGGSLPRALCGDPRELRDVRARGEDERLARHEEPAPVARPETAEDVLERPQRRLAERVRLAPVGAVVDRHERDRADARHELLQVELRDGIRASHAARSPRGAPRPCPSRCRAPSGRSGRPAAARIRRPAAPSGARRSRRAGARTRSRRRTG